MMSEVDAWDILFWTCFFILYSTIGLDLVDAAREAFERRFFGDD